MIITVDTHETITEFLLRTGRGLPSACALGRGCGKCRVKLLSGVWECNGKICCAPCEAVACRTRLKSCVGTIEVPDSEEAPPAVLQSWENAFVLPCSDLPVIALDLGSTTLAGVRIEKGSVVKSAGTLNGQCAWGDNVISRIEKAEKHFVKVRKALLDSCFQVLEELEYKSVSRIGLAGNTVMSCFLHGISPAPIGVYPFKAPCLVFPERRDLFDTKEVVTVPCMTGFLGGDITGGLYTFPLAEGELFLDLGTNCEMVFRTVEGVFGTSAAAGPAFEGAGITAGSRAVPGAVDHYEGKGRYTVIGGKEAKSICGSGVIDFLAVEREKGSLDKFGRFTSGAPGAELAPGVMVFEKDIAEVLKAKAAVYSGICALEKATGSPVKKIKLAGGFSSFLNVENARKTGLLPAVETTICGNTSLAGAARAALSPETCIEMEKTIPQLRELHLNDLPCFTELFTKALLLP